jgi:outer membrane protein
VLYNGVPYALGYSQPLFQFNALRWDKKIEPLKFNESKQVYIESQEQIAYTVSGYFFDLLLAQVNLQIAETNYTNTQKILKIAKLKFDLGKVSKTRSYNCSWNSLNAQKDVGTAKRDMEIATLTCAAIPVWKAMIKYHWMLPGSTINMNVSADKVLAEAFENRSDAIAFIRRIAEAKRDVAKAKGQSGLGSYTYSQPGFF